MLVDIVVIVMYNPVYASAGPVTLNCPPPILMAYGLDALLNHHTPSLTIHTVQILSSPVLPLNGPSILRVFPPHEAIGIEYGLVNDIVIQIIT